MRDDILYKMQACMYAVEKFKQACEKLQLISDNITDTVDCRVLQMNMHS